MAIYRVNHGSTWTTHKTARAAYYAARHTARLMARTNRRCRVAIDRIFWGDVESYKLPSTWTIGPADWGSA